MRQGVAMRPVSFSSQIVGPEVLKEATALKSGEVLLLENIRFNASETSKDDGERLALARELAKLGDLYVGDGFGAVHRKHASVFEFKNGPYLGPEKDKIPI